MLQERLPLSHRFDLSRPDERETPSSLGFRLLKIQELTCLSFDIGLQLRSHAQCTTHNRLHTSTKKTWIVETETRAEKTQAKNQMQATPSRDAVLGGDCGASSTFRLVVLLAILNSLSRSSRRSLFKGSKSQYLRVLLFNYGKLTSTIEVPSRNLAWNNTFAPLKRPSFKLTTICVRVKS